MRTSNQVDTLIIALADNSEVDFPCALNRLEDLRKSNPSVGIDMITIPSGVNSDSILKKLSGRGLKVLKLPMSTFINNA
jgi:hypothetical protein